MDENEVAKLIRATLRKAGNLKASVERVKLLVIDALDTYLRSIELDIPSPIVHVRDLGHARYDVNVHDGRERCGECRKLAS